MLPQIDRLSWSWLGIEAASAGTLARGIDPDSHEVWNTILEGTHG
mgnify:CR=1 FL=1